MKKIFLTLIALNISVAIAGPGNGVGGGGSGLDIIRGTGDFNRNIDYDPYAINGYDRIIRDSYITNPVRHRWAGDQIVINPELVNSAQDISGIIYSGPALRNIVMDESGFMRFTTGNTVDFIDVELVNGEVVDLKDDKESIDFIFDFTQN